MRHRRLSWAVMLLGASLLLVAGRSLGQRLSTPPQTIDLDKLATPLSPGGQERRVIATSAPAPSEARSAPAPVTPSPIQQAAFHGEPPDPPPPDSPPGHTPGGPLPGNGLIREPSPPAGPAAPAPFAPLTGPAPPVPAPALPPGGAPPPTGLGSGPLAPPPAGATGALVSVDVVGPDRVSMGQPLAHEIVVRNTGTKSVAEVHIEEPLPAGVRVLRADPPGQIKDDRVTWDLGLLEAGAERRLKVEVQPGGGKELDLRPRVAFTTSAGLRTQIVRPQFGIEMTAQPEQAPRGGRIVFRIVVANHSDTMIHNVKLYDDLPAALRHPKGQTVGAPLGDLPAGKTRTITLETTAVQAGRFRNEIVAQADSGLECRAHCDVVVTQPALSLRLDGPKESATQRDLDFRVEVANPGPGPARNLRIAQTLPRSFEIVAASSSASFDAAQHALVWSLGDLAANQRQTLTFKVKAMSAGNWPLYTSALAENMPEARIASALKIEGAPALTLEVRPPEDPVGIREETVCEVHVFNQGDAPCNSVRLTAWLADEVTPVNAEGPMPGRIQQQQVQFDPLAQLQPHTAAVYRIKVRGQRAGAGRVRVELTAEKERPVQSEMSISVGGAAQ